MILSNSCPSSLPLEVVSGPVVDLCLWMIIDKNLFFAMMASHLSYLIVFLNCNLGF